MKQQKRIIIKKFNFKLEPLLRLRKVEENLAMAGLAKVMRKVNIEESNKGQALKAIENEMQTFTDKNKSSTNVTLFSMYSNYVNRLESEIKQADQNLSEIQPELEEEQTKVIAARKQRRIVELLKERAKSRYDEDLRKFERKELQELNLMKSVHNKPFNKDKDNEKIYKGLESQTKESDIKDDTESVGSELPEEKSDPIKDYLKENGLEGAGF